mmetsp:Transcript_14623/g.21819  ORF Transcript_14623/g.21819 Transcript_14623/m.21819 type:complete len:82 (+) Transcript_14623:804-1049(+)
MDGEEESFPLVLDPLVESVLEVHGDAGTGAYGASCDDDGTSCPLRSVPFPSLVGVSNVRDHDRDHDRGPSAWKGEDVLDRE